MLCFHFPVEASFVTDLGLGYSFGGGVSVNMTITNLFGADYRAIYGAPGIGRHFIAKTYFDF